MRPSSESNRVPSMARMISSSRPALFSILMITLIAISLHRHRRTSSLLVRAVDSRPRQNYHPQSRTGLGSLIDLQKYSPAQEIGHGSSFKMLSRHNGFLDNTEKEIEHLFENSHGMKPGQILNAASGNPISPTNFMQKPSLIHRHAKDGAYRPLQSKAVPELPDRQAKSNFINLNNLVFGSATSISKHSHHRSLPGVSIWGSSVKDASNTAPSVLPSVQHIQTERRNDRNLLHRGVWTGGDGSIFGSSTPRLQDLAFHDLVQFKKGSPHAAKVNGARHHDARSTTLASVAPANAWSYFEDTPLDLTENHRIFGEPASIENDFMEDRSTHTTKNSGINNDYWPTSAVQSSQPEIGNEFIAREKDDSATYNSSGAPNAADYYASTRDGGFQVSGDPEDNALGVINFGSLPAGKDETGGNRNYAAGSGFYRIGSGFTDQETYKDFTKVPHPEDFYRTAEQVDLYPCEGGCAQGIFSSATPTGRSEPWELH